jgi:hypothetical protein
MVVPSLSLTGSWAASPTRKLVMLNGAQRSEASRLVRGEILRPRYSIASIVFHGARTVARPPRQPRAPRQASSVPIAARRSGLIHPSCSGLIHPSCSGLILPSCSGLIRDQPAPRRADSVSMSRPRRLNLEKSSPGEPDEPQSSCAAASPTTAASLTMARSPTTAGAATTAAPTTGLAREGSLKVYHHPEPCYSNRAQRSEACPERSRRDSWLLRSESLRPRWAHRPILALFPEGW